MIERETETLNRARQLVFGNEVLASPGAHMGYVTDDDDDDEFSIIFFL